MSSRCGKILAALSIAAATPVLAQECVIPPADLIGVRMGDGTCYGASKTLAKIMKRDASECDPPPKKGTIIAGTCVPPRPSAAVPVDARSSEERIQALTEMVRELKDEIDALRSDLSVQSHETASDFERIYSRIGR